jgi:hypothetical protein
VGAGPQEEKRYDNEREPREITTDRYLDRWDRVFPRRHGKYWNWDDTAKKTRDFADLQADFRDTDPEDAKAALEHVQAIADSALLRADGADRRATTIAGTVAIAASFTLGGAGVVLDDSKFREHPDLRTAFAIVLAFTTVAFVTSAAYALIALVKTRFWRWARPGHLDPLKGKPAAVRRGARSAHLLDDFAYDWEVSVLKNHLVDRALVALVAALAGIALLAILVAFRFL